VPEFLNDMPLERTNQLFMHPIHQDAYGTLIELITELRRCQTNSEYYQFQYKLLAKVLEVQKHRAACSRVAKRLRNGRTVPADAPELRSDANPNDLDTWELEITVCERVDRQLRSIGDALAWRFFNYDRSIIVGLSRSDPPGPMANKIGLKTELDFVEQHSGDENSFVLLHDLTSSLRIGDATLFKFDGDDYETFINEIKTNPKKKDSAQIRRINMAAAAVLSGGPLPNDPTGHIVKLDIPYKTHLGMLRDGFDRAASRGVLGMKVPGGRTLVTADMGRGYTLWSEKEFIRQTHIERRKAMRRARIADDANLLIYFSNDMVARSPAVPPWAIYPLAPEVCANLTVDMGLYMVMVSGEFLVGALETAGLSTKWVLPADQPELLPGQVVLRVNDGRRGVEIRQAEMQRFLLELVDLDTWIDGIKEMLRRDNVGGHPWPQYSDEWKVWTRRT
jgi:hypothetical protein